ncbi:MAG: hypothetical protein JSS10_01885 [Verrucomicrobia bacterium]|nr:hypothetical protein [Verrucomicrobiota bacterium]
MQLTIGTLNPLYWMPANVSFEGKFSTSLAESADFVLSRINAIFDKCVKQIEHLHTPLFAAEIAAEWGKLVPSIENMSHEAFSQLTMISQPCQILTLVSDGKKVPMKVFGFPLEEKEMEKPAERVNLGFSMVMRLCNTVNWLQDTGVLTPAASLAWRMSFIGAFCALASSSIKLGDSVLHYSSALKLSINILNFTAAVLALYLVFQVSAPLHVLSLMLMTGTLFLSAISGAH